MNSDEWSLVPRSELDAAQGNWTSSSIMLTTMIGGRKRDELDVNKSIILVVEMDCTLSVCLYTKVQDASWADGEEFVVRFRPSISSRASSGSGKQPR